MFAAVDIVLLPPPELRAASIALNRALQGPAARELQLASDGLLPHITLAMGIVELREREALCNRVATLADAEPVFLSGARIHLRDRHSNPTLTSIALDNTPALHQLHLGAMMCLATEQPAPSATMFDERWPIAQGTVDYVGNFAEEAAGGNYWPHITIGYGKPASTVTLPESTATGLAVVQLSNHCTCHAENVWARYPLKG